MCAQVSRRPRPAAGRPASPAGLECDAPVGALLQRPRSQPHPSASRQSSPRVTSPEVCVARVNAPAGFNKHSPRPCTCRRGGA